MEKKLYEGLAIWTVKNSDSSPPLDVILYGYELLFGYFIKIILIIAAGYILRTPLYTIAALFSFSTLRKYAGGAHCQTSPGCLSAMMLLIFTSIYCGIHIPVPLYIMPVLYVTSFTILFITAPGCTKNNPISDKRIRADKKKKALLILTLYYLIAAALNNTYAPILIYISLGECLTLLPWVYKHFNLKTKEDIYA